jgi:hypothetical protein
LSISSLSGRSFLVGTWLSGTLISPVKITFDSSGSDNLLTEVRKSGGRLTSKAICEALKVTMFSVTGQRVTHIHSENIKNISGRKTVLANHAHPQRNL